MVAWERQPRPPVTSVSRAEDAENRGWQNGGWQNGGWKVFWIYWDTAWSLIISGIMFTTIVTHPDAEFVEIQAARRAK